jgi:hypothetical protein
MVLLGSITVWSVLGKAAGFLYSVYSIAATVWFMYFICPYCEMHNTDCCSCGYGKISAKLRIGLDKEAFTKQFKKNIGVIFPLWLVPASAGIYAIFLDGAKGVNAVFVLFCIDAFLILPLMGKSKGCRN